MKPGGLDAISSVPCPPYTTGCGWHPDDPWGNFSYNYNPATAGNPDYWFSVYYGLNMYAYRTRSSRGVGWYVGCAACNIGCGGIALTGGLTWNANGTIQQLAITNPLNMLDTQTCTFGYDDLSRVSSVGCGSAWSQTFAFDPFGNLSKSGTISFQPTYTDPAGNTNNRVKSVGTFTPTYDANGNLLTDGTGTGTHTYAWDSEGRMLSVATVGSNTATVTYDALGRGVEIAKGSAYTQLVYGPSGNKLALMNAQILVKAFVALPGGATAVYNASGLAYYRHSDWLGSSRFASTTTRTMYSSGAYAPYGENYAEPQGVTPDRSFTGQDQDTVDLSVSSYPLYDFMYRRYHPTWGRWVSPDPAGVGAVSASNPQSWNRYAYVLNNPMNAVDPLGLDSMGRDNCSFAYDLSWASCGDQPGQVNVYGGAPPPVGFFENTEIGRSLSLDDPNDYAMAALAFDSGRAQAQQAQRNQEEPGDLKIGSWNINHPSPESCGTVRAVAIGGLAGGGGFLALGAMFPVIAPVTDIIGIPLVVSGGVFGIYYATFCRSW